MKINIIFLKLILCTNFTRMLDKFYQKVLHLFKISRMLFFALQFLKSLKYLYFFHYKNYIIINLVILYIIEITNIEFLKFIDCKIYLFYMYFI